MAEYPDFEKTCGYGSSSAPRPSACGRDAGVSGYCYAGGGAHSINAADKRMQYAIKQIQGNPGGIILDILEDMDMATVERQLARRFYRSESEINTLDLMLLLKGKLVKILRYKK